MIQTNALRKIIFCGGIATVIGFAACTNKEVEDALAKVGDGSITKESFQSSLETLPPQWKARAKTPSGRKQILEHQVRSRLIELEAKDRGIDTRLPAGIRRAPRGITPTDLLVDCRCVVHSMVRG